MNENDTRRGAANEGRAPGERAQEFSDRMRDAVPGDGRLDEWLAHEAGGEDEALPGSSWARVDVCPALAGDGPTENPPAMLARTDGANLIYARKVHLLAGEPEAGKGWVALAAAAERIRAGESVLYIDFEDEVATAVDRLLALDVDPEAIRQRFAYVRPDEALSDEAWFELERTLIEVRPTLAVIDGVTDALGLDGVNLNDNTEVAEWLRRLPHKLKRRGIATVLIDHVVKNADSRGRYSIGAQHKLAKVDVSYHLHVREPFGRGCTGRGLIRVEKDRPGYVRQVARNGWVGEVVGESFPGGGFNLAINPPPDEAAASVTFRPTGYMVKVSRAVEDEPGLSIRGIREAVQGRGEYVDRARECLVREGYIAARPDGPAIRHHPVRPYLESEDENAAS